MDKIFGDATFEFSKSKVSFHYAYKPCSYSGVQISNHSHEMPWFIYYPTDYYIEITDSKDAPRNPLAFQFTKDELKIEGTKEPWPFSVNSSQIIFALSEKIIKTLDGEVIYPIEYYFEKDKFLRYYVDNKNKVSSKKLEESLEYIKYAVDEIVGLYSEIRNLGFKRTDELSNFIKLSVSDSFIKALKYGIIISDIKMHNRITGKTKTYEDGISKRYFRMLCLLFDLTDNGSEWKVVSEESKAEIVYKEKMAKGYIFSQEQGGEINNDGN